MCKKSCEECDNGGGGGGGGGNHYLRGGGLKTHQFLNVLSRLRFISKQWQSTHFLKLKDQKIMEK